MVDLTDKSKYLRARLCNHDSILGFTDQVSFRRITIRCELRPGDRPDLRLDFCSSWSLMSKCFWTWKENWCHPNILSIWSRMIWCLLFLMKIVSHNNGDSAKKWPEADKFCPGGQFECPPENWLAFKAIWLPPIAPEGQLACHQKAFSREWRGVEEILRSCKRIWKLKPRLEGCKI